MKLLPGMPELSARDRWLFNAVFFLQHFFPRSARVRGWKDRVRDRVARGLRAAGKGGPVPVERVTRLSPEAFRRDYLSQGRPVVIEKGGADWACCREWSFASFDKRFGAESIRLVHRKGLANDDFNGRVEYSEEINFGEFLAQVQKGGLKYMRFSPLLEKFPELRGDFDQDFLERMPGESLGRTFLMFIGGPGTFTPLHNAPVPFFFVNVCGIKRWALIPNEYMPVLDPHPDGFGYNSSDADLERPDLASHPGLEAAPRFETVLEPGDLLYVPSWMWHSVRNESATIGVRCGFLHARSMLGGSPALAAIRLLAARNPTIWEGLYYSFIRRDLPERDTMLVTPGVVSRK